MTTEENKLWVLFEWAAHEDKEVIGLFRSWERARAVAQQRKNEQPSSFHDWEEYMVED
jgi:hypothetical protein